MLVALKYSCLPTTSSLGVGRAFTARKFVSHELFYQPRCPLHERDPFSSYPKGLTDTLKDPPTQLAEQTARFWHLGGKLSFLPERAGKGVEFISHLTPTADAKHITQIDRNTSHSQRHSLEINLHNTTIAIRPFAKRSDRLQILPRPNIVDLLQPGNSRIPCG